MAELAPIPSAGAPACMSVALLRALLQMPPLPSSSASAPRCVTVEALELDSATPPLSPSPPSPPPSTSAPHGLPAVTGPPPANMYGTGSCSTARDDLAMRSDPSCHIDYLSHDWAEDDMCSSWRHITVNRREYGQVSRLENASWRAWAKSRFGLPTVTPETLNWFKERDVTWLYGPLHGSKTATSPSPGVLAHSSSSRAGSPSGEGSKRSILKKNDLLETMTRRSTFSLLRFYCASNALALQDDDHNEQYSSSSSARPRSSHRRSCACPTSDLPLISLRSAPRTESPATDPAPGARHRTARSCSPRKKAKKHLRFNEVVEQRIALGSHHDRAHELLPAPKPKVRLWGDYDDAFVHDDAIAVDDDDDDNDVSDDDEGMVMKAAPTKRRLSSRYVHRRSSHSAAVEKAARKRSGTGAGEKKRSSSEGARKVELIAKLPDGVLSRATVLEPSYDLEFLMPKGELGGGSLGMVNSAL